MRVVKFLMRLSATGFMGSVFKLIICTYAYQNRGYEAIGGEYLAVIIFFVIAYAGTGKIIDEIFESVDLGGRW